MYSINNYVFYCSHLIVNALKDPSKIRKLEALARNSERFRTIDLNSYRFLDSLAFLNGSLSDLADDLVQSGHHFPLLEKTGMIAEGDVESKNLLLRKVKSCNRVIFNVANHSCNFFY